MKMVKVILSGWEKYLYIKITSFKKKWTSKAKYWTTAETKNTGVFDCQQELKSHMNRTLLIPG